jgi:outer membrane protein TolC
MSYHRLYSLFKKQWLLLPSLLLIGLPLQAFSEEHSNQRIENQTNDSLISIQSAVTLAQNNDPWLVRNEHQQQALQHRSHVASTLPDPRISLSMMNLPTDSFSTDQENMTQLQLGISQRFSRGNSQGIEERQLQHLASQYPFLRQDRKAKVAVIVGTMWLDAYKAQESIRLIEKNQALFEQLADVAQASYSSALGKTRQQDIIRAQLELTLLYDRLTRLQQRYKSHLHHLSVWMSDKNALLNGTVHSAMNALVQELPQQTLIHSELYETTSSEHKHNAPSLIELLTLHPAVNAIENKIKSNHESILLAKQKYKPQWGINASYGYREDTPAGAERADLLTIGISLDVPLFGTSRQDKEVSTAVSTTEAIKAEKWMLLRDMKASFEGYRIELLQLDQRALLYQEQLLPQMHEQAEAALTAYTNDTGDFAEVVRAFIAELNAKIDHLGIRVSRQKIITQLNYFFTVDNENYSEKSDVNMTIRSTL